MGDTERENQIIDAARTGDEDAWEVLYRRVYPRLHAYLVRRVGAGLAEDAVNETMTRAVAGLERFTLGPAGFDGWVFGIGRRVSADLYRQAARSQRYAAAESRAGRAADCQADPGEEMLEADEQRRLRLAFNSLPPAERELLELRVIAQLSAEETAAVLGRRPGAVRTAQSRALARLRRLMERLDA